MPTPTIEPGSFRDRYGRVFYESGEVYRYLNEDALQDWEALSSASFFPEIVRAGKLVPSERVNSGSRKGPVVPGQWAGVIKHQKIPFISYPYEWCFGMLKDAALLHLELLLTALEERLILKDSSAFNVQWIGTAPIYIDTPSFQRLGPGEPWAGYQQFCQMFLYPLLLQSYKGIPVQHWLRGDIHGIDPEDCNGLMSLRDLFRPGVLLHVFIQAKLQTRYATTTRNVKKDLQASGFGSALIKANAQKLRKLIGKLQWQPAQSQWSDYAATHNYTDADLNAKKDFVRKVVGARRWERVWDLGCNTGTFSRIAAENADCVVAMDGDQLAVEYFYQELRKENNASILPLFSNVTDPSPNLGWRGLERKTLEERGKPQLTLALALIHHIVIGANVPLEEFVEWLASLGTSLVIEFVTKDDPMVEKLLLNKEDIYTDYDLENFERCLKTSFRIKNRQVLASESRVLFHAVAKKTG